MTTTVTLPAVARLDGEEWLDFDVIVEVAFDDDPASPTAVVTRLELLRRADGPAITAGALRALPFSALVYAALAVGVGRPIDSTEARAALRRIHGRSGVRKDPAEHDADVHAAAEAAANAPKREVIKSVMRLGWAESTAKHLMREARERGYLEHSTRSAPGKRRGATS